MTVDTKDMKEIMWRLTFAPCESKLVMVGRFDVSFNDLQQGSEKVMRCHKLGIGMKS